MKLKALLFALMLFGVGACTQRTCPTYTKQDVDKPEIDLVEQTDAQRV